MTALYRKYRPQRFDDVVGQETAVRTLRNAITSDRVAHAYLFTGTKGTGKTTMAKLLAKAMNCETGPTPDPCGTCESCVAIAEGRSMDVVEIDAASNRGIDDVRDNIIDTVAFQPSHGTRRVYILDEAHQLTPAAFNALLKTIEEPPDHVLFVFCTTEAHLMIATVRDRCQRLALAPPGSDALLVVLRRVTELEGIAADDAALRAVARLAQGSFRNALGTLEMLSTTFGQAFTHADVLRHMGAVSEDALFAVTDGLLAANTGDVLRVVEQLVQDGAELEQFARELAEHLRCLLLVRHGVDPGTLGVGDQDRYVAQAQNAEDQRILSAIDCIADAVTRVRVGTDPRIAIETALARACQGLGLPSLALRLAVLEQQASGAYGRPQDGTGTAAPVAPVAATTPTPAPPQAAPQPARAATRTAGASVETPIPPVAAAAPVVLDTEALARVESWWPEVVQRASKDAPLRPVLGGLTAEMVSNGKLTLRTDLVNMVSDRVRTALATHVLAVTGTKLTIDIQGRTEPDSTSDPATSDVAAPSDHASDDEESIDEAALTPLDEAVVSGDGSAALSMLQDNFGATEVQAGQ